MAEGLDWIGRIGAPNLKLAVSTAAAGNPPPAGERAARLKDKLGLWLVAASRKDAAGKVWDTHAPIHSPRIGESPSAWLALSPNTPALLDALLSNQDEEYLEAMALEAAFTRSGR